MCVNMQKVHRKLIYEHQNAHALIIDVYVLNPFLVNKKLDKKHQKKS